MARDLSILTLSMIVALSSISAVQAQQNFDLDDSALAEQAEVILLGRVLEIDRSRSDLPSPTGGVETDYSIVVEAVIKGQVLHSPVLARLSDEKIWDDSPSAVFDDRDFSRQQRMLLFLDFDQDSQVFHVLHGRQGAFHVFPLRESDPLSSPLPAPAKSDPLSSPLPMSDIVHESLRRSQGPPSLRGSEFLSPLLPVTDIVYRTFRESRNSSLTERVSPAHERLRDLARFTSWLSQLTQGNEQPVDYWLDAESADLNGTPGEPLQRAVEAVRKNSFVKATQSFGAVTDPAGDTRENAISDISPDLTSAQISSDGTRLQVSVRIVSATFDPVMDRVFVSLDLDENLGTGSASGTDFSFIIQNDLVRVREYDLGAGGFLTVAELPTTILPDGYLISVPLNLLRGDAVFSYRVFTDVERSGGHSVITDFMPNDGLPSALVRAVATAPDAPSNLQAAVASAERINLTWSDNSETENLFEVERRLGAGAFQLISVVGENITSFEDTGVGPGATYAYRVRARNDIGASGYSNSAAATTPGEVAPTELTALATSTSEIVLSWVDNAASEIGYAVEMKSPGGAFALIQNLAADTETTTVSGLDEATSYVFRVRATGGSGESAFSNEASATTFSSQTGPCVATPTTLCLNQGRFQVEVTWGDFGGNVGAATDAGLVSADSGMFFFFSADNWEMLVKVLDGCGTNQRFWVFAAATTDVEYTLEVIDTVTGLVKTYVNPLGTAAPAITDTNAFATCGATGSVSGLEPGPARALGTIQSPVWKGRSSENDLLPSAPIKQGNCVPGPGTLCLNQGRFQVDVDWTTPGGGGVGTVDAFQSADSGLFWFFSPENLELLIKVLDACTINNRFWVFAAATTDVQYTLNVTDTVTGAQKQYFNAAGNAADAVTDTDAFASCL